MRTFGDIDLVIHPSDWSTAFGLLSANGYHREAPTLPGGYDDRYGKGATLTTVDGLEVDLHPMGFRVCLLIEEALEAEKAVQVPHERQQPGQEPIIPQLGRRHEGALAHDRRADERRIDVADVV